MASKSSTPVKAVKQSLIPPEEQFWKRYSSRHECPLSALGSVTLHGLILIGVTVAVIIAARLGLGANEPLPVQPVVIAGGGGNPLGRGKGPGDGVIEPGASRGDDDTVITKPEVPLDKLPPVVIDAGQFKELQNTEEGRKILKQGAQALAAQAKLEDKARRDLMEGLAAGHGKGGVGRDGGKDSGRDKGIGEGVGEGTGGQLTPSQKRALRWIMIFNTNDGDDYLRQLAEFDAFVAIPEGGGQYRIYKNLRKKPCKGEIEDLGQIKRIFWVDDKASSVRDLASAMGLPKVPPHIVAFFPKKFEDELSAKEQRFKGKPEDQIVETRFQVLKRGGKYIAEVVDQR